MHWLLASPTHRGAFFTQDRSPFYSFPRWLRRVLLRLWCGARDSPAAAFSLRAPPLSPLLRCCSRRAVVRLSRLPGLGACPLVVLLRRGGVCIGAAAPWPATRLASLAPAALRSRRNPLLALPCGRALPYAAGLLDLGTGPAKQRRWRSSAAQPLSCPGRRSPFVFCPLL